MLTDLEARQNNTSIMSSDIVEAIEFVKNFASILPAALPAAAMSKEEVAVLRQQAQAQIAEATLIKELGMKPDDKGKMPHKAFDKDGNQLFGRGVEKVSLNLRLDKPMADLLDAYCDKTGMSKAAAVRQMILVQVQGANLAEQAAAAASIEGETT
jgi:hypothetical protein